LEFSTLKYLEELDAASFREIMMTYGQDVWNLAYILTKRHDMADDIAQDVFLNVYRSIGRFRGESSVKTWLLSITRNTSVNYLRSAFVRKVTLMDWVSGSATSPSAEQEAMASSFSDDIWAAVMKLPVRFREVLVLHAKYELPVKEIAHLLGISEGTVKSRLSRARQKMSAYWKEERAYERV
jgi:RNA polymerase sigma-70 factor (ECF subfamily)